MPVSKAPVAVTMDRNAPRQNTKPITSPASCQPKMGAMRISLRLAGVTAAVSPVSGSV